jgi:galactokinase
MTEAQESFDKLVAPCSPKQLAGPLLHELLGMKAISPHVWGGKGVGSQGDGTAQFVARGPEDRDQAMRKILSAHPQMQCFPLTVVAQGAMRK